MSIADDILASMRVGVYYRPCDIQLVSRSVTNSEKRKILDMLARGWIVEVVDGDGYRRKKLYKTKQMRLL